MESTVWHKGTPPHCLFMSQGLYSTSVSAWTENTCRTSYPVQEKKKKKKQQYRSNRLLLKSSPLSGENY